MTSPKRQTKEQQRCQRRTGTQHRPCHMEIHHEDKNKDKIKMQRHERRTDHHFSIRTGTGTNDENHHHNNENHNHNHDDNDHNDNGQNKNNSQEIIASAFARDGFCILSQVLDPEMLIEWQQFCTNHFRRCFEILYENGHITSPHHRTSTRTDDGKNDGRDATSNDYALGLGAKNGFREIVMRSPGRYELSLLDLLSQQDQVDQKLLLPDIDCLIDSMKSVLPSLLQKSSMEELKLCHLSLLVASPGSSEQGWHADGGHVSVNEHLSCHCYNIFIPLQDVPLSMGPTEFRPGGHFLTRNLGPMMLAAKCRKTLRKPVWPDLYLGDAVIFDYRVLHRGKANTTNKYRNMLVITFCEPWFQDILNFPKRTMMERAQEEK